MRSEIVNARLLTHLEPADGRQGAGGHDEVDVVLRRVRGHEDAADRQQQLRLKHRDGEVREGVVDERDRHARERRRSGDNVHDLGGVVVKQRAEEHAPVEDTYEEGNVREQVTEGVEHGTRPPARDASVRSLQSRRSLSETTSDSLAQPAGRAFVCRATLLTTTRLT